MADEWVEERDKAVLNTVYYCESCNIIIELGDADISIHKRDLPHHKMRRVMMLRCSRCGNVVTDRISEQCQVQAWWEHRYQRTELSYKHLPLASSEEARTRKRRSTTTKRSDGRRSVGRVGESD